MTPMEVVFCADYFFFFIFFCFCRGRGDDDAASECLLDGSVGNHSFGVSLMMARVL